MKFLSTAAVLLLAFGVTSYAHADGWRDIAGFEKDYGYVTPVQAYREQREGTYGTAVSIVCQGETAADVLVSSIEASPNLSEELRVLSNLGQCRQFPTPVNVFVPETAIVSTHTDWEGDPFYLIHVGDGVFTIGWPGGSTTLPAPGEKRSGLPPEIERLIPAGTKGQDV